MLWADLHTHTIYSHGKNTPEEVVLAALSRGLSRIAISEHGPKHMFFPVKWPQLLALRRDIDRLQDTYGGRIDIRMGLEANLLGDGITDVPEDQSIFDFVLFGYHKGTWPVDAVSRKWMRGLLFRQREKHAKENAQAYIHAMENTKKLLAITHPGTYIPVDIDMLAHAAKAHDVALEINEAHKNMAPEDVKIVLSAGAKLLISSDAHRAERVGRCPYSIALARDAGALGRVINWKEDE